MSIELSPEFQSEIEKHESKQETPYDESRREEDFTSAKNAFLEEIRSSQEDMDRASQKLKALESSGPAALPKNVMMGLPSDLLKSGKEKAAEEHETKKRIQRENFAHADEALDAAGLANAVLEDSFRASSEGDPLENAMDALQQRRAAVVERLKTAQDAGSEENAAIAAKDLRIISAAEKALSSRMKAREDRMKNEAINREIKANPSESPLEKRLLAELKDMENRADELSAEYQKRYEALYEEDEGFEEAQALNELTGAIKGVFARARGEKNALAKLDYVRAGLDKLKTRPGLNEEALGLIEDVESRLK